MRADNSIHLVTAAQQRHELTRAKAIAPMHELDPTAAVRRRSDDARRRAVTALRSLDADGQPVTFSTVASAAGVSRSWLYTQPDIKDEIHRLRLQDRGPTAPIPSPQRASDESLRRRLEISNRRNRELADENQRLRRQLANVLGQLRHNGRTDSPHGDQSHIATR